MYIWLASDLDFFYRTDMHIIVHLDIVSENDSSVAVVIHSKGLQTTTYACGQAFA